MIIASIMYWLKRLVLVCLITSPLVSCTSHDSQLVGRWEIVGTADLSGFIFIGSQGRVLVFSSDGTFTDTWRSVKGTWSTSEEKTEINDGRNSKTFYNLIIKDGQDNIIKYHYAADQKQLAIVDDEDVPDSTLQIIFNRADK